MINRKSLVSKIALGIAPLALGIAVYNLGVLDGRKEADSMAAQERSAREVEVKAYLDLPRDIKKYDLNRDTRFQIDEVAELRKANLIPPDAFLIYDKSGDQVSAIEVGNTTSAYYQEKESFKNK